MKIVGIASIVVGLVIGTLFVAGRMLSVQREPDPRAVAPSSPETSFLSTRSGRVHVLDLGEGEVILLVHGSGRSVADWQEGLAEHLAKNHRIIGFDSYGFGLSDRNHPFRYGNALWSRQAIDVLDALGIGRATVVGHSAGGVVAAFLAADHPERIRGAVFVGHGIAMDPMQIIPFLPGLGEIWVSQMSVFGDTFSERHRRRAESAYRIRGTRSALLTFIRRQYTIDGLRLLRGTYEDIEVPVLQVHGERDASIPVAAARRLTGRLREARFVIVEHASHDVHIDAPGQLAREIAAFVAALEPGDS
jgi:2-hydroxymuconate-semialdehyde hydrolase